VPVHEERGGGHWSLAVICFPGLVVQNAGKSAGAGSQNAGNSAGMVVQNAGKRAGARSQNAGKSAGARSAGRAPAEAGPESELGEIKAEGSVGGGGGSVKAESFAVNEAVPEGTASWMEVDTQETVQAHVSPFAPKLEEKVAVAPTVGRPCILFLDSCLQNTNHKPIFTQLRQFLELYWADLRRRRNLPASLAPVAGAPPPLATRPTRVARPARAGNSAGGATNSAGGATNSASGAGNSAGGAVKTGGGNSLAASRPRRESSGLRGAAMAAAAEVCHARHRLYTYL